MCKNNELIRDVHNAYLGNYRECTYHSVIKNHQIGGLKAGGEKFRVADPASHPCSCSCTDQNRIKSRMQFAQRFSVLFQPGPGTSPFTRDGDERDP